MKLLDYITCPNCNKTVTVNHSQTTEPDSIKSVNQLDFAKLVTLIKLMLEDIDLSEKFEVVVHYDPELGSVKFRHYKC